jgi:D-glycero-D-manno-heptose 1,7-bisphosphate phosphatase
MTRAAETRAPDVTSFQPGTPAAGRPGVIFDRDGVLIVDHGYVGDIDRLEWMPGARRAIRRLNDAGVAVAIATNQSGVARGFFNLAAVDAVHAALAADLARDGAWIDAIAICPFLPDATIAAFAHPDHPDRKPNPGMILRLIAELGLDPARTVVIGDKGSDITAATRAAVAGALFPGGDLETFLIALESAK